MARFSSRVGFACFWHLIEAAANIWGPREPTVVGQDGLFALRPVTGWGPVHAGRYHVEKTDPKTGAAIYSADYTIDSNLVRQTLSCEKGPAVVFFGCSYTFGLGLNDGETLPQAFADSLGRKQRVLNLGLSSLWATAIPERIAGGGFRFCNWTATKGVCIFDLSLARRAQCLQALLDELSGTL